VSTYAFSRSEDYQCRARQYQVDLFLTQDTSTSMWFRDRYDVLAMGYAGSVEKKSAKTIYHFYPGQLGTIDISFNTQDTIDLPDRLVGTIYVNGSFFVFYDTLECSKLK
jgi:hypothetical protein